MEPKTSSPVQDLALWISPKLLKEQLIPSLKLRRCARHFLNKFKEFQKKFKLFKTPVKLSKKQLKMVRLSKKEKPAEKPTLPTFAHAMNTLLAKSRNQQVARKKVVMKANAAAQLSDQIIAE
jgi:hypothetical protein